MISGREAYGAYTKFATETAILAITVAKELKKSELSAQCRQPCEALAEWEGEDESGASGVGRVEGYVTQQEEEDILESDRVLDESYVREVIFLIDRMALIDKDYIKIYNCLPLPLVPNFLRYMLLEIEQHVFDLSRIVG